MTPFTPSTNPDGKQFYLCGFPVAHSASPDFHNYIFGLLRNGGYYQLHSTSKVTQKMLDMLRKDDCGGSSVTMPIKVAIIPYLDGITPEGKATGAVNTIVKVLNPATGKRELIGTNTDFLGIRNALLRQLRAQHPSRTISPKDAFEPGTGSAMVIGGGATTRSAVHALHTLGLKPIFLVNRDKSEVEAVVESFPHLKETLVHLDTVDPPSTIDGKYVPPILMIVGAIPAISPKTPAERSVYTIATSVFTIPYTLTPPTPSTPLPEGVLPLPTTRLFLEMAYKPRQTPMLKIATALGWDTLDGIQAMIEQGLAQERMWKAGDASMLVGSDGDGLEVGGRIDQLAREMVERMGDVIVKEAEVDQALLDELPSVPAQA
ncbi:Aminoacid dehydrogenase-like protein [Clavulina sp. PMI_390]|nr:Aminoacid dehydrogenase-like protein [Clavulina sp. PMI_390]